jgi:glutamyl-tRNA synthetase
MIKKLDDKIKAYALKNALAYHGKAQPGSVVSALFNEGLKKNEVKKVMPKIQKVIKEINKLSLQEQKKEFEKLHGIISERHGREGLPELPKAKKGKVMMRFAPSASGGLHIGHAATACISFLFVREYGGKFYIRIEDTNPENIYKPAYNLIEEESKWLFDNSAEIVIQSDRMEFYYKYAEKLIKLNKAYVCTCDADKFREFVKIKKSCPCRSLTAKEHFERWKKMLDKKPSKVRSTSSKLGQSKGFKHGEAVLRFKSSMNHKNPAMRDFPLARVNTQAHPRQKKKYRVWPLMNLAVAVDDLEQGMTHVIRAKDHRDNAQRQAMIFKALGKAKQIPWTGFLGRIKFKDMILSTTKMVQGIKQGKYKKWDDPVLPTISSLKKQGYKPQAFWKLAERVGLSENDKVMDKKEYFQLLDTYNKNKKV